MGGGEKKIIFVYDRGRVENNRYSLIKRVFGNQSVTKKNFPQSKKLDWQA